MPSLTQRSHTALRLGAIHKKPSVPNRMYVERTRSSSMWAKAIGLGLSTLHVYDHYELICAEPDPVSGGTRLAKYPSLCQLRKFLSNLHPNTILKPNLDSNTHTQPSA